MVGKADIRTNTETKIQESWDNVKTRGSTETIKTKTALSSSEREVKLERLLVRLERLTDNEIDRLISILDKLNIN